MYILRRWQVAALHFRRGLAQRATHDSAYGVFLLNVRSQSAKAARIFEFSLTHGRLVAMNANASCERERESKLTIRREHKQEPAAVTPTETQAVDIDVLKLSVECQGVLQQ